MSEPAPRPVLIVGALAIVAIAAGTTFMLNSGSGGDEMPAYGDNDGSFEPFTLYDQLHSDVYAVDPIIAATLPSAFTLDDVCSSYPILGRETFILASVDGFTQGSQGSFPRETVVQYATLLANYCDDIGFTVDSITR